MDFIYKSFTIKSFLRRKKDWRGRIFLCTAFFTILLLFVIVYSNYQFIHYKGSMHTYGKWNISIYQASSSTTNRLKDNGLVDEVGTMSVYGTIQGDNSKTGYIGSIDSTTQDLIGITFEQGTYPEKYNEIALEKEMLLQLGIDSSIGSEVNLYYTDELGNSEALTFTLCGIINSYHNSYLKQGPLVTAFVSSSFNNNRKYPAFYNNFVTLQDGYQSEEIFTELSSALKDPSATSSEKWYYNSYINTRWNPPAAQIIGIALFSIVAACCIYHSYYSYYTSRYRILINSNIIGLTKHKIYRILFQEALTSFVISAIISMFTTLILVIIMEVIILLITGVFSLYINIGYLFITFSIMSLSVLLAMLLSLLHNYIVLSKAPKLRLPVPNIKKYLAHCHRSLYIWHRYVNVYKVHISFYIIFYTIALCALFLLVNFNTLYLNDYSKIIQSYEYDYSIGCSPFDKINLNFTPNSISADTANNLAKLNDITFVMPIRYFNDTVPVIEISEKTPYSNFLVDRTTINDDSKKDDLCIIYIPESCENDLKNTIFSGLSIGDSIPIHYNGTSYNTTVNSIFTESMLNTDNMVPYSDTIQIYLGSALYEEITGTTETDPYNYVAVNYNTDAPVEVVTNIIDSIIYNDSGDYTIHNVLEKKRLFYSITTRDGLINIFIVLALLFSFIIQANHHIDGIRYLLPQIKIAHSIGLPISKIKHYIFTTNLVTFSLSFLPACLLTLVLDLFNIKFHLFSCTSTLRILYCNPALYLYRFLAVLVFLIIYTIITVKALKSLLENV